MHCDIIEMLFGVKESDVDKRGSIEAKPIDLVQHEDLMGNLLVVQEFGHVRNELQEFIETIPEWDDHS